jgi:hypothetical protein
MHFPIRSLVYLAFAVAFLLGAVDGGSVLLTRIATPDDVKAAGQAAAEAVDGMPTNRRTAEVAYAAAADMARRDSVGVATKGFTVYPDGRVRLTGTRTAPTVLMHRIPALEEWTRVTATVTVAALPYH